MKFLKKHYWKAKFYSYLSRRKFMPYGFYQMASQSSDITPRPLEPRSFRDLILNKMMFPDNPARAIVADKIAARGWVMERIGAQYLVPLYDICDSSLDLKLDTYTLPFVIKSNHASGHVILVKDMRDCLDIGTKTKQWLARQYRPRLEWVYRDINRRLIVEKMLSDKNGAIPADIRVHCFFGDPVLITYSPGNLEDRQPFFFDPDWKKQDIEGHADTTENIPEKPVLLDKVLEISRKLSQEFDYIRVDLYECQNKIYFGELTNFTLGGTRTYSPYEYDVYLLEEYDRRKKAFIQRERDRYSKNAVNMFQR